MRKKVGRKTFAASEDLLGRLSEIAESRGLSLYSLINQVFTLAIRAEELNVNLEKTVDEYDVLEKAKDSGYILVPEGLWREIVEEIHLRDEPWASRKGFEAGEWLAKRCASRGLRDPLGAFLFNLRRFLWNIPEFNVKIDDKTVSIRLVSPRLSKSHASLTGSMLEGALHAFGYAVTSRDFTAGAVRLLAEKGKGGDKANVE